MLKNRRGLTYPKLRLFLTKSDRVIIQVSSRKKIENIEPQRTQTGLYPNSGRKRKGKVS
jgi:hypothetical protein